ncbi:uncharacterized protein LOC127629287 [Xyrauchen texanus]|uniref:uncharacterized protein LOC127629287 n=1 Tax=Xyrauchen texanus TaxID=154827 RepID=UPI002241FF1A|nr:uncharacterized protein LOC127629287 [Xyrauchen texanus]
MSEEQRVSASKLIPLYRMLQHKLAQKKGNATQESTVQLGSHLQEGLHSRCGGYETFRALALATLLDPRFKNVAFGNPAKALDAEKHITLECASLMRSNTTPEPQMSTSGPSSTPVETQDSLWEHFDNRIRETQMIHNPTADATVEVKKYLSDAGETHPVDPYRNSLRVMGSSMPLVGDHQAEDQQLIADMVNAKMNHVMTQNSKRPAVIQPRQNAAEKDALVDAKNGPPQKAPPQGCLQYISPG